jgi:glycopeptide antibiotics resistance protein
LISLGAIVFTPVDPNSDGLFGFIQISGVTERFLNLFLLVPLAVFTRISLSQLSFQTVLLICVSTSTAIEIVQLLIPGRLSDLVDVFANSLGAFLVLALISWIAKASSTHVSSMANSR